MGCLSLTDIAHEIHGILVSKLCHSELEMLFFNAIRFSQYFLFLPRGPFLCDVAQILWALNAATALLNMKVNWNFMVHEIVLT